MKRSNYICYRSFQGDFLEFIKSNLPAKVYDYVYSLYLIHSVEDMLKFEEFELFRATYKDVRCTFQQYGDTSWCCKIEYK